MKKVLVIADVHGRKEIFQNALDKFENEGYDIFVSLGDLCDSYDRTDEDILTCVNMAIKAKEKHGENYVQIIGNHDYSYFLGLHICSGFRQTLNATLNPLFKTQEVRNMFKVCHREGNYLFSHAGVQRKWFLKHLEVLNLACGYYGLPHISRDGLDSLNQLIWTSNEHLIAEVGSIRGGMRYDYGGPFWCDKTEMLSYGPIVGLHQVVGHTPVKFIQRIDKFEGDKKYNNTSVTFCDVLGTTEQFLTLEI